MPSVHGTISSVLTTEQIRRNYEDGLALARRYFMGDADVQALDLGAPPRSRSRNSLNLKLASGMTAPDRPRDLDDVIQLVRANALPREFADTLDPWVRSKFDELWGYAQIPADE
jgi:hypothetical protein